MFTGLVTAVGTVRAAAATAGGLSLDLAAPYEGLADGESIAVAGACLTVTRHQPGAFAVQVVPTSLARTRFGEVRPGDRLNLERAVRAGEPLGGHLVQGHVDGVGTVRAVAQRGEARLLDLEAPAEVWTASVPLGSVTVEGVSLTVNALPREGIIQVALIPFTLEHTTLGGLAPGHRVHLEGDLIGKYVRAFMERSGPGPRPG